MIQPDSTMSAEEFASKLVINPAYGLIGTQQITWVKLIKARDEAIRNAALEEAAVRFEEVWPARKASTQVIRNLKTPQEAKS